MAILTAAAMSVASPATAAGGVLLLYGQGASTAPTATDSLVASGLARSDAQRRVASQSARLALGKRLADQIGSRSAGFWLDQRNDTVVVNVIDQQAAGTIRRAGATARTVARSFGQLETIRDRLARLQPAHTAVGIDVPNNQVVVSIGSAASAASQVAALLSAARRLGGAVRVERFTGGLQTDIWGGDEISSTNGGGYCSLGFNTTPFQSDPRGTALTAGHCAFLIGQWNFFVTGQYFGPSIFYSFPGNDFGLIRNDGGLSQPGVVGQFELGTVVDITGAADPVVGMAICKSGATSHVSCGTVLGVGIRVCYDLGCVDGLASSNAVARPGDSGGPWYAGSTGYGLTSGSTLDGSTTFFEPVLTALTALNINLL
jgi:streptogrisin D